VSDPEENKSNSASAASPDPIRGKTSRPDPAQNERNERIFNERLTAWREWLVDLQGRLCRGLMAIALVNRDCLGKDPLDWVTEHVDNYWATHRAGFKNWAAVACDQAEPESWSAPGWLLSQVPEKILAIHVQTYPLAETLDGRVFAPYTELIRQQIASLIEMRLHMTRIAVFDDAKIKIASEPVHKNASQSVASDETMDGVLLAIGRRYGNEWDRKWFESTRELYAELHSPKATRSQFEAQLEEGRQMEEKERKETTKVRFVIPPAPAASVGGRWIAHSTSPKLTERPLNPPTYFPRDSWSKACVILDEAIERFPDRKQLPELCRRYILEMTPRYCEVVETGKMTAAAVLMERHGGMADLLESLLLHNGGSSGYGGLSNEAYRIYKEATNSEEWRRLRKAIAEAEEQSKRRARPPEAQFRPDAAQGKSGPAEKSNETESAGADLPSDTPLKIRRGEHCNLIIAQIRRVKHLCIDAGRTMTEARGELPDLEVWKLRENLTTDDRETFDHPRRWGPVVGYALRLLAKEYGRSVHTISAWRKASRKSKAK
jgi:hypothetical protein